MESYGGFENHYGWYRTVLHRDAAGPAALHFSGQSGEFAVFLNGQPASFDHLDTKAGDNALAILVRAGGRQTLYGFTGPIGNQTSRGLWGGVSSDPAPATPAVAWKRWSSSGNPGAPDDLARPGYDDSSWQAVAPAAASAKMRVSSGASWFRGVFNADAGQVDSLIQAPAFGDGQSTLYLNGKRLTSTSQDVSGLLTPGANTLLLEVHSKKGDSGTLAVSLWHNSPLTKAPWYFHGGLAGLDETAIIARVTDWSQFLTSQPWQTGEPAPNLPTFYKSTFTYHHPAGMRETIGLLTGQGLKAGHVWLNGHNLGQTPEKIPLYMPECWLVDGENDLVIFDLDGGKPSHVQLTRYESFSIAGPGGKVAGL